MRMHHPSISLLVAIASIVLCRGLGRSELAAEETPAVGEEGRGVELFEKRIQPLLVKECYECHSKAARNIEGGLELDVPNGLRRGGDSGPTLIPHQVDESPLLRMLRHVDGVSAMPPERKLAEDSIAAFSEWIRLGAPDPRRDSGPTAKEQRLAAGLAHWAFQPPRPVELPPVRRVDWPRDDLDRFLLARMEERGVQPVDDASRRSLVRRVFFDLIGLPPSPRDVEAFVASDAPDALAKLVDRLLDSPRFGERWGRHWLDVVRYAESSGMEFNFTYPHAWPYRNYVIDALNDDKPFDLFLREQIAGDLMAARENDTPEAIEARHIAVSVLAFGPKRHNSGGVQFQMDVVDDQINTVTRATLALTVACARCHDHKFDPIPTRDYYALAGIFLSTEPLYGTIQQKYSNNPTDLLPIGLNAAARHAIAEDYEEVTKQIQETLAAQREELKKAAAAEHAAAAKKEEIEAQLLAVAARSVDGESIREFEVAEEELEEVAAALEKASARVGERRAAVAKLETEAAERQKHQPSRPAYAMTARDRAEPADTKIAIRGDPGTRGDLVRRGFLSAVRVPDAPKINPQQSGRLELALWITSPENPLTARVMVNRIWHHLFGRGLVSTVDNFGVIGKTPSHPELLDMLARRFVREGWSIKRLIRSIMLSRTYQLGTAPSTSNMAIDPDNRLFWRATPRRLQAEAIRDTILAVSGQLDLRRPDGSSVTMLGDQLVRGIATEKIQPPSNHRSVYLPVVRDYVPELFDLFDFPSPSLVSGRRSVTNVPSQALYLCNSPFVAEHARHAARRLLALTAATDDAARVDLAMRWALARRPSDSERADALRLVDEVRNTESRSDASEERAWAAWFHALFSGAEFRYLVDVDAVGDARNE